MFLPSFFFKAFTFLFSSVFLQLLELERGRFESLIPRPEACSKHLKLQNGETAKETVSWHHLAKLLLSVFVTNLSCTSDYQSQNLA